MPINAPKDTVLSIAIASPLRRLFDYKPAKDTNISALAPGMRICVPFGHQKSIVGILVDIEQRNVNIKLRPIHHVLDEPEDSALTPAILDLCRWCSRYYHFPLGELCHLALPTLLRKPTPIPPAPQQYIWQLTAQGEQYDASCFGRAHKQYTAWLILKESKILTKETAKSQEVSATTLKALITKSLVEQLVLTNKKQPSLPLLASPALSLNPQQQQALEQIHFNQFNTYLLEGVTGSGKTEVYLQAIEKVIAQGQQALVLVPEIGLTPQTVERFKQRFNAPVITLHSGISDKQRYYLWQQAKSGHAAIVIGTRSSIFTPLPQLGLIIVDEEHDLSYKQQDGVRYSARETSIIRAQQQHIPIILGSATPSLETLHNARNGRFTHLQLTERATDTSLPKIHYIDSADERLSPEIIKAIAQALAQQQQVLVFINRRGYSPTLICKSCGWMSECHHCDSRMTLHKTKQHHFLHCHHCDTKAATPKQCPNCHSTELHALGQGTQRSEEELNEHFKDIPILRIDRDSISHKGALEDALKTINSHIPCILVGTQMLAKGHHFAKVSLAVILGLDNSFFSSDFRGAERMGQLLTQVAGRAGREQQQGTVLLQTQFRDHPLLKTLVEQGYPALAQQLLAERQLSDMPPYHHLALVRCHAQQASMAVAFLQQARALAEQILPSSNEILYIGPLPAAIEKRNNRFYYHLQIKSQTRSTLHQLLHPLCLQLEQQRISKGLHWLIDVDPQEV